MSFSVPRRETAASARKLEAAVTTYHRHHASPYWEESGPLLSNLIGYELSTAGTLQKIHLKIKKVTKAMLYVFDIPVGNMFFHVQLDFCQETVFEIFEPNEVEGELDFSK